MKNLTIRGRLIFALGCLSLLLMTIGGTAWLGLKKNNDTFRAVYDNRLVALGQLDHVVRSILRNQVVVSVASHDVSSRLNTHLQIIEENIKLADTQWAAYIATGITAEERVLLKEFENAMQSFRQQGLLPALNLLRAGERDAARSFFYAVGMPLFEPVRITMDRLIQLQLDISRGEFEQAQRDYDQFKVFAAWVMLGGTLLAVGMLVWLIHAISRPLHKAVQLSNAISDGDLTQRIEAESTNETGQLLLALKEMNGSLAQVVGQVRSGTNTIAVATEAIASGNLDLSQWSAQQAMSVQHTVVAMEHLSALVSRSSENVRLANELALVASAVALDGGVVVTQAVGKMEAIKMASTRIAQITEVIDGIAFQTNILALNAAVEAAHAGAQGNGFAVVASEVRQLAQHSAQAAREIKTLIEDSVTQVSQGAVLVGRAGVTMTQIVDSIAQVKKIMGEISVASQEQVTEIELLGQAVGEIDGVTQQNVERAAQAVTATSLLREQASGLAEVVSVFKLLQDGPTIQATYQPQDILGEPRYNKDWQEGKAQAVDVSIKKSWID